MLYRGLALFAVVLAAVNPSLAQNERDYAEILRSQLFANRKAVIAEAMDFRNEEASKRFWLIYREYESELTKIGDRKVVFLKEYAKSYRAMSEEKAQELITEAFAIRRSRTNLVEKYVRRFQTEMGSVIAARFLQMENQILLVTDLGIASNLPLVQPIR